jgi:hypothetical protein
MIISGFTNKGLEQQNKAFGNARVAPWNVRGTGVATQPQDLGKQYLGQYNAFSNPTAGQVEGGAAQGFFYNPTGKAGGFQKLTSSALDDPRVYEGVRNRYLQFGNDPVWLGQLNTASDTARKKFEGSSSSLDPSVIAKMWK